MNFDCNILEDKFKFDVLSLSYEKKTKKKKNKQDIQNIILPVVELLVNVSVFILNHYQGNTNMSWIIIYIYIYISQNVIIEVY